MTNMPKLSARANKALDALADGGQFADRLERNSYTGREQWTVRLLNSDRSIVSGIGRAALNELKSADMVFVADSFSTAIYYGIKNGRNEKIAELRRLARGPAEGFEYSGWEADAARAQSDLAAMVGA